MLPNTATPAAPMSPPAAQAPGDPNTPPVPMPALQGTPAPPTQAPAQAPPQVAPEQVADIQHHSMVGKIASSLFGGYQTKYEKGPNGEPVETKVPDTPGQLFRNILGGVLMGAAAGANAKPNMVGRAAVGSPFMRGLGAGLEEGQNQQDRQRAIDNQNRAKAQQDFTNQRNIQKDLDEHQLNQATVAVHNATAASETQQMNLRQEKYVRENYDRMKALDDSYEKDPNAIPSSLTLADGTVKRGSFTPKELMDAVTKNSKTTMNPSNSTDHRIFINLADGAGVSWNGTQLIDDMTGKAVDMSQRTQIKAYDVHKGFLDEIIDVSGKELKEINPKAFANEPDDSHYQMTRRDQLGLVTVGNKQAGDQAETDFKHSEASSRAIMANADMLRATTAAAQEKLEDNGPTGQKVKAMQLSLTALNDKLKFQQSQATELEKAAEKEEGTKAKEMRDQAQQYREWAGITAQTMTDLQTNINLLNGIISLPLAAPSIKGQPVAPSDQQLDQFTQRVMADLSLSPDKQLTSAQAKEVNRRVQGLMQLRGFNLGTPKAQPEMTTQHKSAANVSTTPGRNISTSGKPSTGQYTPDIPSKGMGNTPSSQPFNQLAGKEVP